MITQEKLKPRFSLEPYLPGIELIVLNYVTNDLGYLSEYEAKFKVVSIYHPQLNITDYYFCRNNNECQITMFNNADDLEGLIEHLNKKPYEYFLRLKAYGLIK